mgnify:CR=1 FL=1
MARPKLADDERKDFLLSLRLTADEIDYLDDLAERIEAASGFKVSRSAVAARLLKCGRPILEKEYPPTKRRK